jgi:8-oxo-(d)GTP phosphatase
MTEAAPPIESAGVVVSRKGPHVLLVHRPKYDDWSFPKGKLDPGEHATAAAVREVAEETGLHVRLGPPLSPQHYTVRNGSTREKVVSYWAGRVVGDDDVSTYRPNAEIDGVRWVPLDEAPDLLSYRRDRETLSEFKRFRKKTHPLIVLRHGKAESRKAWTEDDRERPLNDLGVLQGEQLVPLLGAYGVRRILSSTSRRCWTTLTPFADVSRVDLEVTRDLSEEDATSRSVTRHVHRLLSKPEPSVLCTHRPVLPYVYEALGVCDPSLKPGEMLVVHHRSGQVIAVEHHRP